MLTVSKALSSGQAQKYHKLEFTSKSQNYYGQGDEVKGEWQGKLTALLGLTGNVAPLEFSRLAEGVHPQTEEPMVRHRVAMDYKKPDGTTTKAVEHRAGWDATFSAPKSVSLTALDELERYTQARIGGNNSAETTGKFIAAKFEHDTARPVDGYAAPQLHTHAVIFNVTERENGSTRALQERAFFESQQYATAVYQSALTYQLRNLGYQIESGRSGAPEIKGYSQEYLDASSPRSRQIREQLEKSGYSGPEAAQIAAHSTRDRKQTLSTEEVLAAHKGMAAAFGNQPQQVIADARNRALQQDKEPDQNTLAKEAVTFARESIFEREAVADERAILRDALRRGMGEASYRDIRAEFESRREAGELRSVQGMKHDSARSFTTPETIAAERANIGYVVEGRNAVEPMMTAEMAREQANTRSFLNDSQRRVIEEVLNSSDRIHGLQGLAGSGKTTTLQTIREGAETSGYVVEGFAPTSKAAGQLREAGIDATTLQSFLARGQNHPSADPANRHLYMLDESSLASTKQMRSFLSKLNPDDRVLVIGDTRQHQGVDAGRPFQQMQEAGMQTSQLDQIMRQKDPELLKAVQHLANNETVKGVAMLAEQGRVTEIPNERDRIVAIARDYAAQPENTIIVSPDNRNRQQINEVVRVELRRNGTLAEDGQVFRTLTHRSDMTGAEREWAARYSNGDVLQYTTGSRAEGIGRGSFATVRSVDARANTLTVESENGASVTYDPRRLKGVNVFREVDREFAPGDRLQFTVPNKDLGVANRDLGTVTIIQDSKMTVRLDGKTQRTVTFDAVEFRQFDHGYAVTSHSSQGLTAGRVLANIDTNSSRNLINSRLAYVAISRASDDARVYTNNAETLGERLASDITKSAAVDFKEKSSTEEVRQAVSAFRSSDPAAATESLQRQGRVHEYASSEHRLASITLDYASQLDRAVIVAPEAAERRELTQLIRSELQAQGRLSAESRSVPVLVERDLGNPLLAANYAPDDRINYRKGSPEEHGIADNSSAIVVSVDARSNLLTVETREGDRVSYNPALLKQQTDRSTVYTEESRELAQGERIQFNTANPELRISAGSLATVEKFGEDNAITMRLDKGKIVELDGEQSRYIDYGYAVETAQQASVDRILITGNFHQIAEQREALTHLSPHLRDLAIYTSDDSGLAIQQIASLTNIKPISVPALPEIELEGMGIGM
jgi:hypothetical protein